MTGHFLDVAAQHFLRQYCSVTEKPLSPNAMFVIITEVS